MILDLRRSESDEGDITLFCLREVGLTAPPGHQVDVTNQRCQVQAQVRGAPWTSVPSRAGPIHCSQTQRPSSPELTGMELHFLPPCHHQEGLMGGSRATPVEGSLPEWNQCLTQVTLPPTWCPGSLTTSSTSS